MRTGIFLSKFFELSSIYKLTDKVKHLEKRIGFTMSFDAEEVNFEDAVNYVRQLLEEQLEYQEQ